MAKLHRAADEGSEAHGVLRHPRLGRQQPADAQGHLHRAPRRCQQPISGVHGIRRSGGGRQPAWCRGATLHHHERHPRGGRERRVHHRRSRPVLEPPEHHRNLLVRRVPSGAKRPPA
eukprot:9479128-Pyramimonas_sp.AAC.2